MQPIISPDGRQVRHLLKLVAIKTHDVIMQLIYFSFDHLICFQIFFTEEKYQLFYYTIIGRVCQRRYTVSLTPDAVVFCVQHSAQWITNQFNFNNIPDAIRQRDGIFSFAKLVHKTVCAH
jgi:hypothetical protein